MIVSVVHDYLKRRQTNQLWAQRQPYRYRPGDASSVLQLNVIALRYTTSVKRFAARVTPV